MIPGSANPLLLKSAAAAGGYQIERSLRFSSNDSAFLSRAVPTAGSLTTWTWAGWAKRSSFDSTNNLFAVYPGSNFANIRFANQNIDFAEYSGGSYSGRKITTAVFRDPSAWYHIVATWDTTNGTAADRMRLYVNGVRVDAFSTSTDPGPSATSVINTAVTHRIGTFEGSTEFFNGYLADIYFIDGQALTPSSFTEVSATTGQLIPKTYTGTFTGNSFWLKFSDNSSNTATTLGKDYSGNSNNWTPNNLQTTTGGPTSVAAASGALPVYNTTDTYGAVKGSGTRTDTNSASIVLAVPMDGTNNGTTFTDESATIKGSGSAKSLTRTGTITSTAQSKFYGSSGYFDGASRLTVDLSSVSLSSAYTVEFWWYKAGTQSGNHGHFCLNGANNQTISYREAPSTGTGSNDFYVDLGGTYVPGLITQTINTGSWNHFAFVHEGSGVFKSYLNGALQTTKTVGTTGTMGSTTSIGGGIGSYTGQFINGYVSDYRIYQTSKYTGNFNPPSSTQNATVAAGNDSLVDTPTSYGTDTGVGGEVRGNYCTLNPLNKGTNVSLSNGNLDATNSVEQNDLVKGTIGMSDGKWYAEFQVLSQNSPNSTPRIGLAGLSAPVTNDDFGNGANEYAFSLTNNSTFYGRVRNNGSWYGTATAVSVNDIAMCAFDASTGKMWFGINGTWFNSGNPAAGTNPWFTASMTEPYFFTVHNISTSVVCNFGARAFSYQAPSGFKALVDTNLPAPVVAKPNTVMDVKLYTGNGSTQTISGLGFSPDLVWLKNRSAGDYHRLNDIIRGANRHLFSNTTDVEVVNDANGYLSAFTSDGFSVTSGTGVNASGNAYVAWTWDAGSTTVTNTQGSITSSLRASPSSGFSVVTYTTTGSAATIGHGLNVAPSLIITKQRNGTTAWYTYHTSIGAGNYLLLNSTAASAAGSSIWNNTAPTSTVFSVGNGFGNGETYVAYCFSPVVGYSSMGSYVGNGSSDGPAVWLGFRPKWLLIKRTDSANDWYLQDSARDPYNPCPAGLFPNLSAAEDSSYRSAYPNDMLSNGFKLRTSNAGWNASGGTYLYIAFAESPFQYARAR